MSAAKLEELFPPSARLSFLAGSGISLDPPSCQPTGYQFTRALIAHLVPAEKQSVVGKLTEFPASGSATRFIRFEQLMQLLQAWDPDLHVLDGYAACSAPNANHRVLAHFVTAGHPVFTTNFDSLLEHALVKAGAPRDSVEPAIFERDWVRDESPRNHRIFKLHGSLLDVRTETDSRASVQATIRQIAAVKEGALQLESWKIARLAPTLGSTDLVVVGYSGLDDFDVLPTLRGIASRQRLIWIEHESRDLNDARVEVLSDRGRTGKRLDEYLTSLAGSARDASRMIVIRVHTGQFLAWLAQRMLSKHVAASTERCPGSSIPFPDALRLSEAAKWHFTGDILSYFDTDEAIGALRKAVALARSDRDDLLAAGSLTYLGRQYETLANRQAAAGEPSQSNWDEALRCYTEARRIAKSVPGVEGRREESKAISNIGQLYRSADDGLGKALEHFREALAIDESVGDLEGISRVLANTAAVEHARENRAEAVRLLMRACEIDRKLGNLGTLALHLHNLGLCRSELGQPAGLEDVREALAIATSLGQRDTIALCLHTIGTHEKMRRRFEDALATFERGLSFAIDPDIAIAALLRERVATLTKWLRENKNVGLHCACDTPLYFTNEEARLMLEEEMQLLTDCAICRRKLLVRAEPRRIAAYRVTDFRGGEVMYDTNAIATRERPTGLM